MRSVGVTGTNGKTTTSWWVHHACSEPRQPLPLCTPLETAGENTGPLDERDSSPRSEPDEDALLASGARPRHSTVPLDVDPQRWLVTSVGSFIGAQQLPPMQGRRGFLTQASLASQAGVGHATVEVTSAALSTGFAAHWPCEVAVLTNFSLDHLQLHGSLERYLAAKAQLFLALQGPSPSVVLPLCDPAGRLIYELLAAPTRVLWFGAEWQTERFSEAEGALPKRTAPHLARESPRSGGSPPGVPPELPVGSDSLFRSAPFLPQWLTDGIEPSSSRNLSVAWLEDGAVSLAGSRACLVLLEHGECSRLRLEIPLVGLHFLENAAAAVMAAVACGVEASVAIRRIARAPVPRGRFEVLGAGPWAVIDDAHTPDALIRTLETARSISQGRVIVVFGAGGNRDTSKRAAMARAASRADVIVLTSDNPRDEDPLAIVAELALSVDPTVQLHIEVNRAQAIAAGIALATSLDVVVIAGRGVETVQHIGQREIALDDAREAVRALQCRS